MNVHKKNKKIFEILHIFFSKIQSQWSTKSEKILYVCQIVIIYLFILVFIYFLIIHTIKLGHWIFQKIVENIYILLSNKQNYLLKTDLENLENLENQLRIKEAHLKNRYEIDSIDLTSQYRNKTIDLENKYKNKTNDLEKEYLIKSNNLETQIQTTLLSILNDLMINSIDQINQKIKLNIFNSNNVNIPTEIPIIKENRIIFKLQTLYNILKDKTIILYNISNENINRLLIYLFPSQIPEPRLAANMEELWTSESTLETYHSRNNILNPIPEGGTKADKILNSVVEAYKPQTWKDYIWLGIGIGLATGCLAFIIWYLHTDPVPPSNIFKEIYVPTEQEKAEEILERTISEIERYGYVDPDLKQTYLNTFVSEPPANPTENDLTGPATDLELPKVVEDSIQQYLNPQKPKKVYISNTVSTKYFFSDEPSIILQSCPEAKAYHIDCKDCNIE